MARTPKTETSSINDSLKRKESAAASLKELELARQAGKVVDTAIAVKTIGGILNIARNRMLSIPSKITPALTLAQDAETIKTILDTEIHLALTDVVDACSAEALRARFAP